ncbi:MAG: hypothetical protein WCI87_09200 [Euryarchaeota archaeon]
MEYDEILNKVVLRLAWLNANAKHAIELRETFAFPAYDPSIREIIRGTNNVRCYKVCLDAVYFELIMTLMRMFDNYKSDDTACFEKLFECLSADFVKNIESKTQRRVKNQIQSALKEYLSIKDSHLVASLKTVRHKMFAHTSTNFNKSQIAKYGYAEELLKRTLPMLNDLNSAIHNKVEPFDKISKYWKGYAMEFWQAFLKKDGDGQQAGRGDR